MSPAPGTLFVVSTPIGNLGDMTYRAVDVLRSVQLICAEDTRHVRKLLDRYEVRTPVQSYYKDNEARMTPRIVQRLTSGDHVALVTDAGTPLVSDPGHRLVAAAIAAGAPVVPVPGASSLLAALVASGADTSTFTFVGFLPRSGAERNRAISRLSALAHTSVLFESPARLAATLQDLAANGLAERRASVARELTKQHEEVRRGTVGELATYYGANPARGEVVIILEGGLSVPVVDEGAAVARAREMRSAGATTKDIVAVLIDEFGMARNRAYRITQEEDR
ncbi:MAG: 16S rRNA (cytidine(1402)-2'-O)-methyltransferase [Gemmatimonadota bacterium]